MAKSNIKTQVRLPFSVAFDVVMQGIRIRVGRSIVTMLGVALGIAFLMSILAGQHVKDGVSDEEALRQESSRMRNFLAAEMGQPRGRTIGLIVAGPLNEPEQRLLRRLADDGISRVLVVGGPITPAISGLPVEDVASVAELGSPSSAILIVGDGAAPSAAWAELLAAAGHRVVCATRTTNLPDLGAIAKPIPLQRELTQEERDRAVRDARRDSFRALWIIVISLAVTVICISNSMLMSVTERFREIGTMKCLGALSSFIRRLFLIESSLTGLVGSLVGSLIGGVFSILMYCGTFGFSLVLSSIRFGPLALAFVICVAAGVFLSVLAAIYPATIASRMVPADALRSNI